MNGHSLPALASRESAAPRPMRGSLGKARTLAYAASLLFSFGWTLALGKDVHWDALNYHLYLGFSALNDRFALDFFGAGPPSYINPYAYVPLYLMSAANWPALWIALAFALIHALMLALTFEIAATAARRDASLAVPQFALLAALLAASNPVFLQGLGSTLTDISTGIFVLGGWLAIVRALRHGGWAMPIAAGALCGIAAALKLSNAVFAIAAIPALLFVPGPFTTRFRSVAVFCVACATGFVAVALPWSWQLWREFGNPFFPFLNQYFASPEFVTAPMRYERFIPRDVQSFVMRPVDMISAASTVHTEPRAPDLRYAALLIALAALAATSWWRGRDARKRSRDDGGKTNDAGAGRALWGMLAGLAIAWCLWLAISGNSRYFLSMACVASVVLVLVLQRLYLRWPSLTISAILLMLVTQATQLVLGTDLERDGGAWDGPWLRVDVPERLRAEPNLYLSVGFLSGSAFMPYLHPQSGMINIAGFNVIGPGHPGGDRASALIDRHAGRLKILIPLPPGAVDRSTLPNSPDALNVYVRRLGVRVDASDCDFLRVEGNLRGERRPVKDNLWKSFLACRLESWPAARQEYERHARDVNPIFDRVEDTCPNLFHPRRPVTQEFQYWVRTYHMGSEMQLYIDQGRVKYFFPLHGGDPIDIGSAEAWRTSAQPIDCSRRTSPAFVTAAK